MPTHQLLVAARAGFGDRPDGHEHGNAEHHESEAGDEEERYGPDHPTDPTDSAYKFHAPVLLNAGGFVYGGLHL